ncbi:uncharacterized protein Z518_04214 [Rhinocladiella mackenziei CBS 650.93]|uniref:Carboxypeptidase n=1 Tax=Rhinocladiella mackenziei CBS 650.93 TaxID=1442369 RepID=A0A0D2IKJ3_9EURO|nr:uncharacterized protein Z518_04214 [Rhinocladiella mackenziei CBS 650.93]KIX06239.1 hypothetical protein Z518_04214 [Rhinocladiella mackenziei CBS 650.93]
MESGPCVAQPDNNSTEINPWSFNNHVNILYIDQPNFVGFSYDVIEDGLVEIVTGNVYPEAGPGNATSWPGKFGSQDVARTALTARMPPKYFHRLPLNILSTQRANLVLKYAGYFTTTVFAFFQRQNVKLAAGNLDKKKYHHLKLDTLGITNGCVDLAIQARSYPEIAYNNTYNVSFIPKVIYEEAMLNFTKTGGCLDQIAQCRTLCNEFDPDYTGGNETVTEICALGTQWCATYVEGAYLATGRSSFDLSHLVADPWPPAYPDAFFNQPWVREDLGVPLNFTPSSNLVTETLFSTGDPIKQNISDLDYILSSGIKVALVHGDGDYVCNRIGGEALALAAEYNDSARFRSSGYETITTNSSYMGGVVRQAGTLSFSRVFQGGHSVSSYQPETVYRIFMGTMFGLDVATGKVNVLSAIHIKIGT